MWIGVLWAGLRVAMWVTSVGGKFRWVANFAMACSKSHRKSMPSSWLEVMYTPTLCIAIWLPSLGRKHYVHHHQFALCHIRVRGCLNTPLVRGGKSTRKIPPKINKTIFRPASSLEPLLEGLLGSSGGFGRKFPEGGLNFLEVALVWKFPYGSHPKQSSKKFASEPPKLLRSPFRSGPMRKLVAELS